MTASTVGTFGGTNVPEEYQSAVLASAARWGISPAILAAQISAESGFDRNARSSAGAVGIAQFLPSTAKENGVDPYDTNSAIDGMAMLDAKYLKQFGSIEKALAAYNAGPNAVSQYDDVPPYNETQNYVRKILGLAGSAATSIVSDATSIATDPLPGITNVVSQLMTPAFWRRVGLASAGLLIVLFGVFFLVQKQDGSGKVVRTLGNVP